MPNTDLAPANILLVDDRPENLIALEVILEPLRLNLVRANSGPEALRHLLSTEFALILLDVQMPGMDGFETAAIIKERERSRYIPIIFVTAINKDERYVSMGYTAGAVDYITKPLDPDILVSKVAVFVDLYNKSEEIKRQAELLRQSEVRELERQQLERERELERKHLEEIAESEARLKQFKSTLDATLDSVLIFEPKSCQYQYANQGALQLLGYSLDELLQLTPRDSLPEGDIDLFNEVVQKLQKGNLVSHRFETIFRRRNGSDIPVEVSLQYIADDSGQRRKSGRFVSIVRDITERKQAQAALSAAYERERRIATVLQSSMVVAPPPNAFPGITVETFYEPALDEALIGGDFFDVFALPSGKVALIVGDVSGKGLLAAAHIAEVKYALRAILYEPIDAGTAVTRLNRILCRTRKYDDSFSSETFVALTLVILDPVTGELSLVSSGAEPSLIAQENGAVAKVETHGLPLGVDASTEYVTEPLHLAPAETIFIFTDGLTEARQGANYFGDEGITKVVKSIASTTAPREVGQSILNGARAYAGGKLHDDACLLVARRHPFAFVAAGRKESTLIQEEQTAGL